jgi:hypothetical protein
LLQTVTVKEGNTATYTGTTPTNTEGTDFLGWSNTDGSHTADAVLTNITENKSVYAAFARGVVVEEITDSWDTIIANIDNGTYASKYSIGNYKPLDLGTEGTINMQIVAMDADELASGGTAPLTFLGMELLNTAHRMNMDTQGTYPIYEDGTGSYGGWEKSELRSYLKTTIKPLIPSAVRSRIQEVKKYSRIQEWKSDGSGEIIRNYQTAEDVWIPSYREIYGGTTARRETLGVEYKLYIDNITNRVKHDAAGSGDSPRYWWVRSVDNNIKYSCVTNSGYINYDNVTKSYYIALGFCLGLEPAE